MKFTVRLFSLSCDDDEGTHCALFPKEGDALDALLDKLEVSTTVQTEFSEYTREKLKHFYFFPADLPETYEDFFELLNEIKDPADSHRRTHRRSGRAEHTVHSKGRRHCKRSEKHSWTKPVWNTNSLLRKVMLSPHFTHSTKPANF